MAVVDGVMHSWMTGLIAYFIVPNLSTHASDYEGRLWLTHGALVGGRGIS